jgi:hypothetical protein
MRAIFVVVLSGILLTGCKHARPSDSDSATSKKETKTRTEKAAAQPKSTPVQESSGRVASVNSNLRFVVIDFSMNPLPPADQHMNVYRQGQKVGEVKISKESSKGIIAADITAGDAQIGDEVRAQ